MKEYSFEKLEVWKLAKKLSISVYDLTEKFPQSERFGIISQLQRAAVSVPTNIAEGSGRISAKEKANFSSIAFGSLMEVLNLLIISHELKYISEEELKKVRNQIENISFKLSALRKSQLNPKL
jgi:four helix bundle protein